MSECVVRMEMLLNCLECPMYDYNRHKLCCNAHFDLRPIPNGGVPKPDWCPIICQLPEGHGRLVDADALLDHIVHNYCDDCDDYNGLRCRACPHDDDVQCIEDAPTIVPAAERSET